MWTGRAYNSLDSLKYQTTSRGKEMNSEEVNKGKAETGQEGNVEGCNSNDSISAGVDKKNLQIVKARKMTGGI